MTRKLQRFLFKATFTRSNRIPNKRSRHYLIKQLCEYRKVSPSAGIRGALGIVHRIKARVLYREPRIPYRTGCILTGRLRATSRRFSVARTRVKLLSAHARLIGARKSSW